MSRFRHLLTIALLASACRADPVTDLRRADDATPSLVHIDGPYPARSEWISMDVDIAVRLPRGLTYCPILFEHHGMTRSESFFLVPPPECKEDGPDSVRTRYTWLPTIDVSTGGNVLEYETALESAAQSCKKPIALRDFKILNRPVAECRAERGDTVEISLFSIVRLDHPQTEGPPVADITLGLRTSRRRLPTDWRTFTEFTQRLYRCERFRPKGVLPSCPPEWPQWNSREGRLTP